MKKLTIGLLVLCAALMLAACGAGSSPEKAAEKFIRSSYAGDAEAVMQMIYISDEDKKEVGIEDMMRGKIKAMVAEEKAKVEAAGGVKEITVSPAEYSDNNTRAQVKVSTTFKKSERTDNDTVRLIKTDKGWKIWL